MSVDNSAELRLGRLFESEFERKAHNRGLIVIRHCDQLGVNGVKAPMATGPHRGFRLPDFTIIGNGTWWVEAKFKAHAAFYALDGCFKHGVDLPNWRDYLSLCEATRQRGFLVVGEGDTGEILIASFERLKPFTQTRREPHATFDQGGVYWPREVFHNWGRFNRTNGQTEFRFDFRDDVDWRLRA